MAGGSFGGGSGTSGDPYLVEDAQDLNAVRLDLAAHYRQTKSIDLTIYSPGEGWSPIGNSVNKFNGTYNGDLYLITDLTIERPTHDYIGLFGYADSLAKISNVRILNGQVRGNNYVGALVGYLWFGAEVSQCGVSVSIQGNNSVGGFIGGTSYSTALGYVSKCYSMGVVSGNEYVGGFIGRWGLASGGPIDCYARGNVSGASKVGGFAGGIERMGLPYQPKVTRVYSTGAVAGAWDVGGLIGIIASTATQNGYYNIETSGQSDTGKGIPKTTTEMKTRTTYESWDFPTAWLVNPFRNNGYPYLAWQEFIDQEHIPNYPPQSYIELNFTAGDSTPYPMGRFFIDRTQSAVGRETVSIQARNSIGKYLKDQTFDERFYFPTTTLKNMFEQILLAAGITNYHVAANNTQIGMEFPPNMEILTGIQELLKLTPGWIIREEISGKVVIGPRNDVNFTQPSKYTFYRNRDIFSRGSVKDDNDAYGRVCCHTADYSVRVYRPVPSTLGWLPPAQKTFYVQVPDGTRSSEAASLAVETAEQMANSGEVETFVGPYRPHLLPGDEAEIIDEAGPNLLGIMTTVEHAWSKGGRGFATEFTVDSGGKIGKPQLREFIDALAGRQKTGAVKL